MKHLLLPTCFAAVRWSTVLSVFGTKLAVTKITLDLEGVSHISTARRLTYFFIWLLKTTMSGAQQQNTILLGLQHVHTCDRVALESAFVIEDAGWTHTL